MVLLELLAVVCLHQHTYKHKHKHKHKHWSAYTDCNWLQWPAHVKEQMEYEAPNKRLYTFLGKLTINGQSTAVDNDAVLLRGAVLRCALYICMVSCVHSAPPLAWHRLKGVVNHRTNTRKRPRILFRARLLTLPLPLFRKSIDPAFASAVHLHLWQEYPVDIRACSVCR